MGSEIVVLDGYALNPGDLSWEGLEQCGDITVYERTPSHLIVERSLQADILLTNKTVVSAKTIEQLPNLKYIGVLATGYDVVDIDAASKQGIIVTNIPAYGTESVAQFVLINTARGKLIREADLADALNHDRIAGAAVDVLSQEPPNQGNPLFTAKHCIITPHIAWASRESRTRLLHTAIENVSSFLKGTPGNIVAGRR